MIIKIFDKSKSDVFPKGDFAMCTEHNKFNFVMRIKKSGDGFNYMEKIDL